MKLFKNKKTMTGIIASLVGLTVLLTGISLAWFTNSGSVANNEITLGRLGVNVTLDKREFDLMYPGQDLLDNIARIKSFGNLPTLVQLDLKATVTIKSDANGNPLPESEWTTVPAPANLFNISLQEEGAKSLQFVNGNIVEVVLARQLGDWYMPDYSAWYHWGMLDGKLYVMIDESEVNHELRFAYKIETDGRAMTNLYQGASVNLRIDWLATQYIPDAAIEDVLDIDILDVNWFDEPIELDGISPFFAASYADKLAERIAELPDCSYKELLKGKLAKLGQ